MTTTPWCPRPEDLCWGFVNGGGRGWVLAVVLGLSSLWAGGAPAGAQPASRPAARHRHRAHAHPAARHLAAHCKPLKRSRRSHDRAIRRLARAAAPPPAASAPPDVAFVTLTTAVKGTSLYVDSRRVG